MITVEREFHGRTLSIETGRVAKQASGSVIVRCGESAVLVTVVLGGERDMGFFPLTIDYVEKTYAAGKIPGGYLKREGRLSDRETLTSRLIDRPCRPLFPKGFKREVQVIATVLSFDPEVDTDVLALCGASTAISISEIPFDGPIAGVRVCRIGGKLVINPSPEKEMNSDLSFVLAGSSDAIMMVEGGAEQVPEAEVLEALFFAHSEMQVIIDMQKELVEKAGKEKIEYVAPEMNAAVYEEVKTASHARLTEALNVADKLERKKAIKAVKEELIEPLLTPEAEDAEQRAKDVMEAFSKVQSEIVRGQIFEKGVRIDGRDTKTVRPIEIETEFLPRVHGSALFTRGETQAIVAATLGIEGEAQRVDTLLGDTTKEFMLHYNFPPFCVGETKMLRGPGRREVGHGTLAERAVSKVLPPLHEFPYTIRVVSEITESNGSSSMASVCGASLSLMDAGVPLLAPVAGVAMGLIQEGENTAVLTDILGDEDHLGDMDFKVCGTDAGITALQMDIKIKGLDKGTMTEAMEQARVARLHILEKMNEVISTPRETVSQYAPRIVTMKIAQDKIRDLIGPGGKVIKSISEAWDVTINVDDDGSVAIAGSDAHNLEQAQKVVNSLTEKAEEGKLYKGIVKRVVDFGCFVEILPGTEGLVHISQLAEHRVRKVTDVTSEGDEIWVKVLEIDRMGKIRLSHFEALQEMEQGGSETEEAPAPQ